MTDQTRSADTSMEIALLRALVQEQLVQITDLTQRLAEAQAGAQAGVSADPQLHRASLDALERRLQDARALALSREATLAEQILADGAALQALQAAHNGTAAALDAQHQAAARQVADLGQRISALESDVHVARDEALGLRADLDRIYASHSWKLTEPLRAGRRLLGGG